MRLSLFIADIQAAEGRHEVRSLLQHVNHVLTDLGHERGEGCAQRWGVRGVGAVGVDAAGVSSALSRGAQYASIAGHLTHVIPVNGKNTLRSEATQPIHSPWGL